MQICDPRLRIGYWLIVADETTRAIDRFYDVLDKGVDAADRVINRHKYAEEKLTEVAKDAKERRKRREIIDAEAVPTKPKAPASFCTAVAKKPHFYIVESVDPRSGTTLYVVTDGGNARTECSTREFAQKILRALEGEA